MQQLKSDGVKDLEKYITNNPNFTLDMVQKIKIINVNKATLSMFEAKNSAEFVDSVASVFGENSLEIFKKEILAIWRSDNIFREESNFRTLKGTSICAIISFSIPKTEEESKSIPVSILDITQIKQKDDLLFRQSKMASMGEMIGNIAHQWRQPLTTISMDANNMIVDAELEELNSQETVKYSKDILKQTEYLSKTIDDFRNFFKAEKEISLFKIKEPIEKTLKLLSSQFKNKEINIISTIEDIEIKSLQNELIQVLINILNNARDELIKKDYEKYIFINVTQKDSDVEITIKDNAGGISDNIINRVFEPYFTTKTDTQGTGIGLYMVNEIINKHLHGKITIENVRYTYKKKIYTGALFKITLSIMQTPQRS